MNGDEDLGEDIIMKGEPYHYNQKRVQRLAQEDDGAAPAEAPKKEEAPAAEAPKKEEAAAEAPKKEAAAEKPKKEEASDDVVEQTPDEKL